MKVDYYEMMYFLRFLGHNNIASLPDDIFINLESLESLSVIPFSFLILIFCLVLDILDSTFIPVAICNITPYTSD